MSAIQIIDIILIIIVLVVIGIVFVTYTLNNNVITNGTNVSKVINFDKKKCINSNFADEKYSIGRTEMSESINGLSFFINENDEKIVNILCLQCMQMNSNDLFML